MISIRSQRGTVGSSSAAATSRMFIATSAPIGIARMIGRRRRPSFSARLHWWAIHFA